MYFSVESITMLLALLSLL